MWIILLVLNLAYADQLPRLEFIDSRDDSSITWLFIDDCAVALKKTKLKDFKYVERELKQICHVDLELKQ